MVTKVVLVKKKKKSILLHHKIQKNSAQFQKNVSAKMNAWYPFLQVIVSLVKCKCTEKSDLSFGHSTL